MFCIESWEPEIVWARILWRLILKIKLLLADFKYWLRSYSWIALMIPMHGSEAHLSRGSLILIKCRHVSCRQTVQDLWWSIWAKVALSLWVAACKIASFNRINRAAAFFIYRGESKNEKTVRWYAFLIWEDIIRCDEQEHDTLSPQGHERKSGWIAACDGVGRTIMVTRPPNHGEPNRKHQTRWLLNVSNYAPG